VAEADANRWLVVAGLGTSQTLAWASSYYLIAILAPSMARDTASSITAVFTAFSASLLISALLGPRVGRTIDRFGGREVLAVSNVIFAAGLIVLGISSNLHVLWVGWLVMGVGMGLGLYDSAFAALGRMYGQAARQSITGITLIAGFASTVGWPLTAWGEAALGWRSTCFAWAAAHLALGLPLNLLILPKLRHAASVGARGAKPHVPMDRAMWLLGFAFAAGWVVSTAMAAHLPRVLEATGATTAEAITAAALVGPAQVAARILEAGYLSRYHPLVSARLSTLTHPIGAGFMLILGGWLAMPFVLLHGAGNGILTIARGTVPLAVFGPEHYGYRLGLIGAPARILQAGAPIAFGVLIDSFGALALLFSSLACLAATGALLAVAAQPNRPKSPQEAP
jgi:predicted MFS family arabinose efflux permease